jgi:beta-lactamase class A
VRSPKEALTGRRSFLALSTAGVALSGAALVARPTAAEAHSVTPARRQGPALRELRQLERRHLARLGVFAWDTATDRTILHRAGERFPMASTFKTLAVAAVLRDLNADGSFLGKTIRYTAEDTTRSGYAPVTGLPENLERGMTVEELCAVSITHSDNAATNLLLKELGGPAAVTRFCRSLGDTTTRLDRWEPDLNSAEPGRVTDTSTPLALGKTYARVTLGNALRRADRTRLTGWLLANTTGAKRLRAGLPGDWRVAEKTGTGEYGTTNDAGLAWPPGRDPIMITVLSTKDDPEAPADEPLLAEAAKIIAKYLG